MKRLWLPRQMVRAPTRDPSIRSGPAQPRTALLINPFYKKIRKNEDPTPYCA